MFYDKSPLARIEWLCETNGHCQFLGIDKGTALLGSAGIQGVSSLVGGKKGASAATQAAQIQANAALTAAGLQQQRFEQIAGTLQPFIQYGAGAMGPVQALTGTAPGMAPGAPLTAPLTQLPAQWQPTMAQLAQTPGYQFSLQQGLLAAQSGSAAQSLGQSGSAVKAAESFAQGLASTTYNQQFQNFLAQQQLGMQGRAQTYNMLTGQIGTGLSAAGALGGVGIQSAQQVGQSLQAAGAAQAGGIVGGTQALVSGMQGAAAAPTNALMMAALLNQSGFFQNPTSSDLSPAFTGDANLPTTGFPTGIGGVRA